MDDFEKATEIIYGSDVMDCIILAGGKNVRFNGQRKALVKVNGKTLLERQIEHWKKYCNMVFVAIDTETHHNLYGVLVGSYKYSNEYKGTILVDESTNKPLGTAGAVKNVLNKYDVSHRFIVVNVDDLADINGNELKDPAMGNVVVTKNNVKLPFRIVEDNGYALPYLTEKKIDSVHIGALVFNKKDFLDNIKDETVLEEVFRNINPKNCYEYTHKGYWFPINDEKQRRTAEKYFVQKNI